MAARQQKSGRTEAAGKGLAFGTVLLLAACAAPPSPKDSLSGPQAGGRTAPVVASARPPALPDFKGLKPAEVVSLLGQPDFRRVEPPAELWQYRTSDCVLDLFFYRDGDGFRVSDAETRGRAVGARRCTDDHSPWHERGSETPL